jgi:hypothetical protein
MTITLVGYYFVLRAWDRQRNHRPIEWMWPIRKVGIQRVDDWIAGHRGWMTVMLVALVLLWIWGRLSP